MKKIILSALTLTLLCGCASLDSDYSEPVMQEMTETISATDTTTTAPETIANTSADSGILLDRGVYEIQETEEMNPDLTYDNRFKGEFCVFFDDSHGEYWSAYDGRISSFTCEQAKESMTFHETNVWENNAASMSSKFDFSYVMGTDHDFRISEEGNVVFDSYGRFMFSLVKRPDLEPDTFDATQYKSDYVLSDHGWLEAGAYAYKGKRFSE